MQGKQGQDWEQSQFMTNSKELILAHIQEPDEDEFFLVINMRAKGKVWLEDTNINKLDFYLPP